MPKLIVSSAEVRIWFVETNPFEGTIMRNGGNSAQYETPFVHIEEDDRAFAVIDFAWVIGATCNDGEDDCFVVEFYNRPGIVEVYTERALRSSIDLLRAEGLHH